MWRVPYIYIYTWYALSRYVYICTASVLDKLYNRKLKKYIDGLFHVTARTKT